MADLTPYFHPGKDLTGNKIFAPYLDLGRADDAEVANMIVMAVQHLALSTTDCRIVEYALKLMLAFKQWKDQLPKPDPSAGTTMPSPTPTLPPRSTEDGPYL